MRRPLAVATAVSGLLLSVGTVPLLGTAAAAACPTWTDAPGDAGIAANGNLVKPDESIDITAVTVQATGTDLVTTFTVPKLATVNDNTSGDRFQLTLTAGGTALRVFTDRDDLDLFPATGVANGNTTYAGGTAKYDVPGKKVVLTMPYTVFNTALGKPFAGLELKTFGATVLAQVTVKAASASGSAAPYTMETAPAPATVTMVGGVACGSSGGGGPVTPPPTTPPPPPVRTTGPMPTDLPKAGCFTLTDDKGDAKYGHASAPNDPDLDITGATYRSTADWFLTYIKVDALGTNPAISDGHRFSTEFTFNKHVFAVAASSYKNAQSYTVRETIASTGAAGKTVQMTLDPPTALGADYARAQVLPAFVASGAKATFDTKASTVVIGIPIADIEKYGKASFDGATLEAMNAESTADLYRNSLPYDATEKGNVSTGTAKWTTGDNKCFTTPTKLTMSVAKAGAVRTVTAKLTTTAGQAIAAKPVAFFLNGKKGPTILTASNGTAVLRNVKPGTSVKAVFTATGGYLGSTGTARA